MPGDQMPSDQMPSGQMRSAQMHSAETANLKPGSRWRSAVCESEVIVVRAPSAPVLLCIGGAPVLAAASDRPANSERPTGSDRPAGTLLGKRYADEVSGLEVLCTRSGEGTITVAGRPATILAPRKLPASD
jgi:hypothetical protein